MLSDDDPLAEFNLPPEVMSSTFEHAISDAAAIAHLRSGAVARCGGPSAGWHVTIEREPGVEPKTIDTGLAPGETDTKVIVERLARVLKRW